jgi:hypothetical protein
MHKRFASQLKGFLVLVAIMALVVPAPAKQPKQPVWTYAFDLKCRNSTQPKFDMARTFGIEVFRDANNDQGIYITETGVLAAIGGFAEAKATPAKGRTPEWMHGLDLKCRPPGVEDFANAKVFGVEVFRDENNAAWTYITEVGGLSLAPGARGFKAPTPAPQAPQWTHGLDLKVRKAGDKAFAKETKVWSVEVFLDDNSGNLIYLCDSGQIAIVPGFKNAPRPKEPKAPEWLHGLDLKCRKGGQRDFDGQTKSYGVEVFRDENNGNLIYISETGSLAIVPGKQKLPAPTPQDKLSDPEWTHGLDLKCRKVGQKDFDKNTPVFGVEVFRDNNTGCYIYVCETGAITAVASPERAK